MWSRLQWITGLCRELHSKPINAIRWSPRFLPRCRFWCLASRSSSCHWVSFPICHLDRRLPKWPGAASSHLWESPYRSTQFTRDRYWWSCYSMRTVREISQRIFSECRNLPAWRWTLHSYHSGSENMLYTISRPVPMNANLFSLQII